jgi:hypothetical protein
VIENLIARLYQPRAELVQGSVTAPYRQKDSTWLLDGHPCRDVDRLCAIDDRDHGPVDFPPVVWRKWRNQREVRGNRGGKRIVS